MKQKMSNETACERIVIHHHPDFTDADQKQQKQDRVLVELLEVYRNAKLSTSEQIQNE